MPINVRKPVVAGQFYPKDPNQLKALIASLTDTPGGPKRDCLGCILPHAGYIYSGRIAVSVISQIKIKDTVVLLGPNHTGEGSVFSIMTQGAWQTPLGNLQIDQRLAKLLLKNSKYLREDTLAHAGEHSLEVELPILQYFRDDFKIVPVTVAADDLLRLTAVGEELASVLIKNRLESSVTLLASSDMTHYESHAQAQKKDALAIEAILALDEYKLEAVVKKFSISMCGFAPIVILIRAAKLLGAKKGELIKYQTSGEITLDKTSVVGYAGITIN